MFQALKRDKGFYRYLAALTGPIALQNLITFSLGLIDTFMVSKLGNNEMAAVTAANVPVFLLISIVFGVQSGVGILISQYWGKKDLPSISRAIGVAAGLGVSVLSAFSLAGYEGQVRVLPLAEPLSRRLGAAVKTPPPANSAVRYFLSFLKRQYPAEPADNE